MFAVVITIALAKLVSVSAADRDLAIQVAAAQQSAADQGSSTLGGQVQLLSGGSEASGVAVEIFSATALGSPLTSTATDAAGNWKVPNLPAGAYKLRFRGAGFAEVWYPQALTSTDAKPVDVQVGQKATNLNVTLGGLPATISGSVVGDNVAGAVLTLSVPVSELPRDGAPPTASSAAPTSTRPTQVQTGAPVSTPAPGRAPALGAPVPAAAAPTPAQSSAAGAAAATVALQPGAIVKSVPIGSDGSFTLDNVISPAVYELTVSKAGYATASQKVDLDGGEDREGVDLRLRTGDGLISGTIIGPAGPVGGAVVTATTGTTSMKTVSLTRGAIGTFILRGLVTPGSYTVTVVAKGFGTQSSTLSLTAGQKLTGVRFTLARSAGAISGTVTTLPDNKPAPNVTVAVTGGSTDLKTVTQSATAVGSWKIDGLAIPGSYTVTFSREGLESQTVAVALRPDRIGERRTGRTGHRGDHEAVRRHHLRHGDPTGPTGRRGERDAVLRDHDVRGDQRLATVEPTGPLRDHRRGAGDVHPVDQPARDQPHHGHRHGHRRSAADLRPGADPGRVDQRHGDRRRRRHPGRPAGLALPVGQLPDAGLPDHHHR